MAMKVALLCVVALIVVQITFAQRKGCGEGEVWKIGMSSSCGEKKCGDPEDGFRPCTMDFVSRCFCGHNLYRRSSDNKCVPKAEC
ncbi:hypothetical protein MTO96_050678 [Rhipicephalus appendiculatus]